MKKYTTPQEDFWSGSFGKEYTVRNNIGQRVSSNIALFSQIFRETNFPLKSVLELGAGSGNNLRPIRQLFHEAELTGVEINKFACKELKKIEGIKIENTSILDFKTKKTYDLVLTKGVLIHINPDKLSKVYSLMYKSSKKFICIVEYYNPTPTQTNYRGHNDRLFKRDFAGEMLDKFKKLRLVNYGFVYHRDNNFPLDDYNWFLLEKV